MLEKMEMTKEKEKTPEIPEELEDRQRRQLKELLDKYKRIFSETTGKLGRAGIIKHEIHTRGQPIRQPYRRQNPTVRQMENEQLAEMLDQGVIRPSYSPWASPVVMVKKKDETKRFGVDYRRLNAVTE